MKRLYLICLGLCATAWPQPVSLYQQGHAAYQAGDYQKAAECYESVVQAGYQAFELFYNLGNCYYKLQQTGRCMLNYEKARKLNPLDPDLLYNLELAQLRVVDKIISPPEFFWTRIARSLLSALSLDQLALVLVGLLFLAVALTIAKLFVKRDPWRLLVGYSWWPLVILASVTILFFALRVNQSHQEKAAIIMVDKVSVLSSPSVGGTEVFALHEGSKVRLAEKSHDYVRISLPDGKVGWAPLSSLHEI